MARLSVASVSPNPENKTLEELANSIDICYTAAPDGWEMKFCSGDDVLEVVSWADDPRLRNFEEAFVRLSTSPSLALHDISHFFPLFPIFASDLTAFPSLAVQRRRQAQR